MEKMLISALIALAGLFSVFCSLKNYDWFMEHRKAKALSAILTRTGARIFYATLGVALFMVGTVMFFRPHVDTPDIGDQSPGVQVERDLEE